MELRDLPSVDELARDLDDPLAVDAARAVLDEGDRPATDATVQRIAQTLRAAAADEQAAKLLTRGRLTDELEPGGFDVFAGVEVKPRRRDRARPARERKPDVQALRARVREARARARELDREAAAAERDAERAERAAEDAREKAERARAEADAAAQALAEAEEELERSR
jgi:chromosome segregation ATPase